jgi:hypothetical protein
MNDKDAGLLQGEVGTTWVKYPHVSVPEASHQLRAPFTARALEGSSACDLRDTSRQNWTKYHEQRKARRCRRSAFMSIGPHMAPRAKAFYLVIQEQASSTLLIHVLRASSYAYHTLFCFLLTQIHQHTILRCRRLSHFRLHLVLRCPSLLLLLPWQDQLLCLTLAFLKSCKAIRFASILSLAFDIGHSITRCPYLVLEHTFLALGMLEGAERLCTRVVSARNLRVSEFAVRDGAICTIATERHIWVLERAVGVVAIREKLAVHLLLQVLCPCRWRWMSPCALAVLARRAKSTGVCKVHSLSRWSGG